MVRRICLDGMMAAIYIALIFITIRIGDIRISFGALPIMFVTLCLGLPDGLAVAFIGEFIGQMINYGFTPTTFLWVIPPMLRVVVLWLFHLPFKKKGDVLYNHIVWYYVGAIVAALFVTASNTLVMYLDAIIIGYPITYVLVETIIRFAVGMLSSAICATILLPVTRVLKKGGYIPAGLPRPDKKKAAEPIQEEADPKDPLESE